MAVSSPIISSTSLRQPGSAALLSVPCYDKDDADSDTSLHSKKTLPLSLSQSPKYALLVPSLYAHRLHFITQGLMHGLAPQSMRHLTYDFRHVRQSSQPRIPVTDQTHYQGCDCDICCLSIRFSPHCLYFPSLPPFLVIHTGFLVSFNPPK